MNLIGSRNLILRGQEVTGTLCVGCALSVGGEGRLPREGGRKVEFAAFVGEIDSSLMKVRQKEMAEFRGTSP